MTAIVRADDIVTASDIARLLGVGNSAVSNWLHRPRKTAGGRAAFPAPFTHVNHGKTPLYRKSEIVSWYLSTLSPELLRALQTSNDSQEN